MAYNGGSAYRPTLPPRSPRSSFGASSIPQYSHFPPPPSTSPFGSNSSQASAGSAPHVPPRPTRAQQGSTQASAYQGHSPASNPHLALPEHGRSGYSSFPPPIAPSRHQPITGHRPGPPLPPRPQPQVSGTDPSNLPPYAPSPPGPAPTPGALSPNQLTSFPPPPPGPPPLRTSPSFGSYPVSSLQRQFLASPITPVTSAVTLPQQVSTDFRSKLPLPPDAPLDPDIPSSPPPAYTPVAAPGSRVPPGTILTQHSTQSHLVSPSGIPTAPSPLASSASSPYTAFPAATIAPIETQPPILSRPAVSPSMCVQPPYPTSSPPLTTQPLSSPQSPHELSFFPAPPFPVTPVPRNDPMDELMLGLRIGTTPVTDISPADTRSEGFYSPLSTPGDEIACSPRLGDMGTAPIRPPKTPLASSGIASSQSQVTYPGRTTNEETRPSLAHADAGVSLQQSAGRSSGHSGPVAGSRASSGSNGSRQTPITRKPVGSGQVKASTPPLGRDSPAISTSCIDTPMTFITTWYFHAGAPDFTICSRCYTDFISSTKFANAFQGSKPGDGTPRTCRFSKPRMKDHIFPNAVSTSYLQPLIDFMRRRSAIPDCRGGEGVSGLVASHANMKWYHATNDSIPGFVVCEACYEDHALCSPSLASSFQPHPETQGSQEVWACDFALPFIQKQYELDGKNTADPGAAWANFAREARYRLSIPRCGNATPMKSHGKTWFRPIAGPPGLTLCASCYCDQVINTGEEPKWMAVPGLAGALDNQVRCSVGGRFNIRLALARAHDIRDFTVFWVAMKKLEKHPVCGDEGVRDAEWWTLPGQPDGFQVCGACYVTVCEPLGVQRFFTRKFAMETEAPRCCFNIVHPRLKNYMPRLLEMYFTQNPSSLVKYASTYAAILPCGKDKPLINAKWYGWRDCMICVECYQDFAQHHRLVEHEQMPLRNVPSGEGHMCEMYSSRMRQLFLNCSRKAPPDATELLEFAEHRRRTYQQTVPQINQLVQQQNLALSHQWRLNAMSDLHLNSGQAQQSTHGMPLTYSGPGLGRVVSIDGLRGAEYGRRALGDMPGSPGAMVNLLEERWRAVE